MSRIIQSFNEYVLGSSKTLDWSFLGDPGKNSNFHLNFYLLFLPFLELENETKIMEIFIYLCLDIGVI